MKALVMKEARYNQDLEMKDKRIANFAERVKTLERDKTAALKEAAMAREEVRSLKTERDELVNINEKLQAENERLMVNVSV